MKNTRLFHENYNGILTHEGTVKVAKSNITARILNISDNTVLVRGFKKNSYHCRIHKDLLSLLVYVEKGDMGFIKFKNNEAFLVGFKKENKEPKPKQDVGPLDSYFKKKMEA